jgi:uncharacterized membrane protein YkvA (DUF1232 family)
MNEPTKYSKNFTEDSFWLKLKKFAKKAGTKVVYAALLLYYALQSPKVPFRAKAIIVGALGYFIAPLDMIPDIAPGIGYGDDLGALIGALLTVAMYLNDEITLKAREKVTLWFGNEVDEDIHYIDQKIHKSSS